MTMGFLIESCQMGQNSRGSVAAGGWWLMQKIWPSVNSMVVSGRCVRRKAMIDRFKESSFGPYTNSFSSHGLSIKLEFAWSAT